MDVDLGMTPFKPIHMPITMSSQALMHAHLIFCLILHSDSRQLFNNQFTGILRGIFPIFHSFFSPVPPHC